MSLKKNAQKCQIFSQKIDVRPRDRSEVFFVKIGRSEICLVCGSPRNFVQIVQKVFAVFHNLKNFVHLHISIIARTLAQEINFLQSQNLQSGLYTVYSDGRYRELGNHTSDTMSTGIGIDC